MAIVSLSSEQEPFQLFSFVGILGNTGNWGHPDVLIQTPLPLTRTPSFSHFLQIGTILSSGVLCDGRALYILADVLVFRTSSYRTPRIKFSRIHHSLELLKISSTTVVHLASGSSLEICLFSPSY